MDVAVIKLVQLRKNNGRNKAICVPYFHYGILSCVIKPIY